jgi:ABC-type Fe3+ transport system substrate-binding protein
MSQMLQWMASIAQEAEAPAPAVGELDLLFYAPCPVKLAVKDGVDRIVAEAAGRGERLAAHIPMGCTSVDPFDPIFREPDPGLLPGIIASIGFGDFWRQEFVARHLDAGAFAALPPARPNPLHVDAGMLDPQGRYTIYGATPYIFLVDRRRLGEVPPPRSWADVLDPRFAGELVMCGDGDDMADAVVLNLFKDRGREGLRDLAANAKGLMHSSRMAKIVGSAEPDAGAVFIIPLFFAQSIKLPPHVEIIWPEDGAAASPLYFLAKKSEQPRLAAFAEFFLSGFAAIPSAQWFVPLGLDSSAFLPPGAKLKWVGWDFIARNDVTTLRDALCGEFRAMVREHACA